jgi:hypothetical protein
LVSIVSYGKKEPRKLKSFIFGSEKVGSVFVYKKLRNIDKDSLEAGKLLGSSFSHRDTIME